MCLCNSFLSYHDHTVREGSFFQIPDCCTLVLVSLLEERAFSGLDQQNSFFLLSSALLMPGWSWKETQWKGKWVSAWQWKKHDKWLEDEELQPMLILKERNQWSTPALFCASDETEEEEEPMAQVCSTPSVKA